MKYSSFWKRILAALIDIFVWFYLSYTAGGYIRELRVLNEMTIGSELLVDVIDFGGFIIFHTLLWLIFAWAESSQVQGSLGKYALSIVVVDGSNQRLTFWRASLRYWSRLLTLLTLFIGFFMAAFTGKKQTLHDMIARTYVIDRKVWRQLNQPVIQASVNQVVEVGDR